MLEQGKPCGAVLAGGSHLEARKGGRIGPAGAFVDEETVGGEQPREMRGNALVITEIIGRIAENQVVAAAVLRDGTRGVLTKHTALEPQLVEIRVDRAARLAIRFDEHDRRGAAAQRLEPERT